MQVLEDPPRFLFFTGKGGVGKTSCACATAIDLAGAGKRVLLVSTDPASNLDEVLGLSLTGEPLAVPGAPGLSAMNIDPEEAARAYRERMIAPVRGILPEAVLATMEEQLSGACTTEIAAFDEFSRLLGDASATAEFDHVLKSARTHLQDAVPIRLGQELAAYAVTVRKARVRVADALEETRALHIGGTAAGTGGHLPALPAR